MSNKPQQPVSPEPGPHTFEGRIWCVYERSGWGIEYKSSIGDSLLLISVAGLSPTLNNEAIGSEPELKEVTDIAVFFTQLQERPEVLSKFRRLLKCAPGRC